MPFTYMSHSKVYNNNTNKHIYKAHPQYTEWLTWLHCKCKVQWDRYNL